MTLAVEQIVKELMHSGIRVSVNSDGDLSLRGRTRNLTEEQRQDLRQHKPEIIHYLSEKPISPVAMYIAKDLESWTTNEPHLWADTVTIYGKQFIRLNPGVVAWCKAQIAKAETACAAGKLTVEAFTRIVKAFCPVYDFAGWSGMMTNSGKQAQRRTQEVMA